MHVSRRRVLAALRANGVCVTHSQVKCIARDLNVPNWKENPALVWTLKDEATLDAQVQKALVKAFPPRFHAELGFSFGRRR